MSPKQILDVEVCKKEKHAAPRGFGPPLVLRFHLVLPRLELPRLLSSERRTHGRAGFLEIFTFGPSSFGCVVPKLDVGFPLGVPFLW